MLFHRCCLVLYFIKWTASSEFGTCSLCEQRGFRRACASAQSRQNLRCSLIQAVNQEEPSDRKPDPCPLWMAGHAQLKFVMTECSKTQIRLTGLKYPLHFEAVRVNLIFYLDVLPHNALVPCLYRQISWGNMCIYYFCPHLANDKKLLGCVAVFGVTPIYILNSKTNSKVLTWNILSENELRSKLKCPGYVQCASGLYLVKKVYWLPVAVSTLVQKWQIWLCLSNLLKMLLFLFQMAVIWEGSS